MSGAKHRQYEKTLKSYGKCFICGKLLRHTSKVSVRFLLRDTLHEVFFSGYQEGNIIDNHSYKFLRRHCKVQEKRHRDREPSRLPITKIKEKS